MTTKRMRSRGTPILALTAVAALALSACGGNGGESPTTPAADGNAQTTETGTGSSPEAEDTADTGTDPGSGESVVLQLATMVQPTTPNAHVSFWFFEELEKRSDGRLTVNVTLPEEICPAAEVANCVRDGRADIGVSIGDYTPQLFPTTSVVSIPFVADNAAAVMEALHVANQNNPAAQAVWEDKGLEPIATWPVGRLVLGSKEPIDNMAALDGRRVRVAGPYLQHAVQSAGGNVVAVVMPEAYEAFSSGIVDVFGGAMDGPVDYKLIEQLSHWADPGVGHYTTFGMWMNRDAYDGLPDDLKQIFDEVREDFNTGAGIEPFNVGSAQQCETILGYDGTQSFTAWDEADTEEWKAAVGDALFDVWADHASENGLSDPEGYLADYQEALDAATARPDIVEDPVAACVALAADR